MMQSQYVSRPEADSLWLAHTVANPSKTTFAAVRWYQVALSDGSAARLSRSGTVNPDLTIHRYMPSLAVDAAGEMAVGYSASSSTLMPGLRYTAWTTGDASGSAGGGERVLFHAGGAQDTTSQWGDYSAMSLDPDGCTFWYTGELYVATGRDWQTGIAAFSLPGCTGTPPPPPPNVEPLEPTPSSKPKATIRQQLEAHATHATCASCRLRHRLNSNWPTIFSGASNRRSPNVGA